MENDEKKYQDVIKALKGLQEVKAPINFQADLQRRINQEKFSKEDKKSFWQNIFVPSRLIPSLGLVGAAVIIFFVVETNSEEMDNPFLIEPRVREDVFAVTDFEEVEKKQEELSKTETTINEKQKGQQWNSEGESKISDDKRTIGRDKSLETDELGAKKDITTDQDLLSDAIVPAESTVSEIPQSSPTAAVIDTVSEIESARMITKEELNSRQVQLTEEEQKTVNELRNQVQSVERVNKTQK